MLKALSTSQAYLCVQFMLHYSCSVEVHDVLLKGTELIWNQDVISLIWLINYFPNLTGIPWECKIIFLSYLFIYLLNYDACN